MSQEFCIVVLLLFFVSFWTAILYKNKSNGEIMILIFSLVGLKEEEHKQILESTYKICTNVTCTTPQVPNTPRFLEKMTKDMISVSDGLTQITCRILLSQRQNMTY